MNITTELPENLLRRLALMQHLGEDYFIIDDIAYEGNEDDILSKHIEECPNEEDRDFKNYVIAQCTEVEELEEDDYAIDYMVLTDEEADKKATNYIKETLWAFNASFLSNETGIDIAVFEAIQDNGKCEDNNDAIESCIDDIEGFVESAISADGRGHFMSSYDGNENEETVNGETFYIYRTN